MNSNEKLGIKGNLNIVLTDAQGRVKDTRQVTNKVTSEGLNHILLRLGTSTPASFMSFMGVGTTGDSAQENGSSTGALKSPAGTRVSATNTVAANVITYVSDFIADPDGVGAGLANPSTDEAITEAGIFSASTGGVLLCRTVFAVVNKLTTDSLRITWKITLTAT